MKNLAELQAIRDKMSGLVSLRVADNDELHKKCPSTDKAKKHILVCGGTGCVSSGCKKIVTELDEQLEKFNLKEDINVVVVGCFGLCAVGPIMIVYPEGSFYALVEPDHIGEIVEEHLVHGRPVKRYLYDESIKDGVDIPLNETPFYKKQLRVALRNCGLIDPECIDEYIAFDGYAALGKVVTEMKPQDVIDTIKDSGLRGRGGAGFSTGTKWQFAANVENDQKYVLCNADEGDPGAFMDRSILEGDPHTIIEAMAIAAYAIGANQGYVYIRAEYPIAVDRLQIAINQALEYGLLGKNIFESGFDFNLEIRLGAGAFVCGEETALITSVEGKRGEPRVRPPFPAVKGLYGKPTIINNVETYANVPVIINKGIEWFKGIGTDGSKGTKVFALGGKIKNIGLVEVPMGITLREIVEEIGGNVPEGKTFKAAQTGGPSGGCIPDCLADTPIDFESLIEIGSMMGSGGLIVMDNDSCMVDIAKFFLEFTVDESCGKCVPCRVGTHRMLQLLEDITEGRGTMEHIEKLKTLSHNIKATSLCGLGQTAPNPVLSTLRYFEDEYIAHVKDHKCPAGVCKSLLKYVIDDDKCVGCGICKRGCPTNAIKGNPKETHVIDQEACTKCGICIDMCPPKFGAIKVI